jgi:hypothetical protein
MSMVREGEMLLNILLYCYITAVYYLCSRQYYLQQNLNIKVMQLSSLMKRTCNNSSFRKRMNRSAVDTVRMSIKGVDSHIVNMASESS